MFKFISIKVKIISVVLLGFLGFGVVAAITSINKTSDTLLQEEFQKLLVIETAKHSEINIYLNALKGLTLSISEQLGTKNAFLDFENSFYNLKDTTKLDISLIKSQLKDDIENNYLDDVDYDIPHLNQQREIDEYIPKNDNAIIAKHIITREDKYIKNNYIKAHSKYHLSFNHLLNLYDLNDLVMVDLKGNVIYTSSKKNDFATNLDNGVYSHSSLAKIYNKTLHLKKYQIGFIDFAPYEPHYNVLTAFISTPIFINGTLEGALIINTSIKKLNAIMTFNGKYEKSGLGESGETYLVNDKYTMLTNSRFYNQINNETVQFAGTTAGILEINTSSVMEIINNDYSYQGTSNMITSYRGSDVLSISHSVNLFSQGKWVIVSEITSKEALKPIISLKDEILSIFIIALIIIALVVLYFVNTVIINPLLSFQNGLLYFFKYLNKKTTTLKYLNNTSNDEIGHMTKIINQSITTSIELHHEIEKDQQQIKDTLNKLNIINKEVSSSIEVASLIQHGILPSLDIFDTYFSEHSIIWEPRDIVGGDIYFAEVLNEDEVLIFCIDCTGHGVPGAFLTLLLKAVVDKVILHYKKTNEEISYILQNMYISLKRLLGNQKNFDFDGLVLSYNKKKKKIQVVAQSGYMFVNQQNNIDFVKIPRLKRGDISYNFSVVDLDVNEGDIIYISTDGFIDQKGGYKDFPLHKNKFIKMLEKYKGNALKDYKKLFMKDFEEHRGDSKRLDDVLVLSIKI